MAQTNRDLSNLLMRQSKLDEARLHLQAALDYYDSIGDRMSWEKARNTLGGIHFQAGEFAQMVAIGEASLPFFEGAKIPYYASVTTANLAESYYELGDLDKAEFYAQKTLAMEETHTFPYALFTLGLIRRRQKKYTEAEKILRQAEQVAADNADGYMQAYAMRLLGEILADQNKKEDAAQMLRRACHQFEHLNIPAEIEATQKLLAKLS
jgi:tetratricopeptide (TPR) repeat protein